MSPSSLESTAIARVAEMQALLAEYTTDFPVRTVQAGAATSPAVVLVTGTTGSLGCHLLETLVRAESISRVYAVNRADRGGRGLWERQAEALRDKGINPGLLHGGKVVLVEADLTKKHFGLPDEDFGKMHRSVTHVLHNAWRVDLVSPLFIFEPNIAGLRALIDFCLTSPLPEVPRLIFTSSIFIVGRAPRDRPVLEDPIPASLAVGSGYTEAKWVSEELVYAASRATPLDGLVVRVGQLCGGKGGAWATSEWFPCMVQSASKSGIGCFPDDDRLMDILPFELCADALLDFLRAPRDLLTRAAPTRTVHLVHPRPVPWHDVATHVARALGARLVPYADWLYALERAAAALVQPGRKGKEKKMRAMGLMPFFHDLNKTISTGTRAMGFPEWDGPRGVAASPALAHPDVRQLGAEDVKRWTEYWRRTGFIQDELTQGMPPNSEDRARL